jgi:deoxyribonuclease II
MKVSALDESGKEIDWWFLYKVPHLTGANEGSKATGYEYVYYDPTVGKIDMSKNVLTDGKGALDLTLNSVFAKPDATTGWLLYNDEMPASVDLKDNGNLGHTKGVIAFDTATKTAIWLLHSWPKYADLKAKANELPTPMYGQTYLCLSLDLPTAGKIAAQMADHQQPQIYGQNIPASLDKNDPVVRLSEPLDPKPKADSNVLDCKTRHGTPFKVIAKNREWNNDFWNNLVGPTLQEDMDVETWIRGPIASTLDNDGVHKTFDIKFVDLRPLGAKWAWPEHKDHAKWAITHAHNWVCVGDINRMISQQKRGGGTIALQDPNLWEALSKTDLLVLPEGMTQDEAVEIIHTTHAKKPKEAPPSKKMKIKVKTMVTEPRGAKKAAAGR